MDIPRIDLGPLLGVPPQPKGDGYIYGPRYESVIEGRAEMQKGMKGPAVDSAAKQLQSLGKDVGTPTDKYGPKMTAAVTEFQGEHGLKKTGRIDSETLKSLETEALKAHLAKNADVQKLSPEHQALMQDALAKDPRNQTLAKDLEALAGNEKFKNLNSATASEVLKRVPADELQREGLLDLAKSDGFGQLNAQHQLQALQAIDAAPADGTIKHKLQALTGSPTFRHLPDEDKTKVLEGMKTFATRPVDAATIADVASSPGFDAMPAQDRKALLKTITSDEPTYGGAAREAVKTLINSPAYQAKDAAGQAADLKKLITDQDFLPRATTAPDGTFTAPGRIAAYTISPITTVGTEKHFTVNIEGKDYPVIQKQPDAGMKQVSPDELARGLAAVPKPQRELIKDVTLEAGRDPTNPDAYMATEGLSGKVHFYATPVALPFQSPDFMASALVHETGHIISGRAWDAKTPDGPKNLAAWKQAMASDGLANSKYGHSVDGQAKTAGGGTPVADDFAEAMLLYMRVKGTPDYEKTKALFPERFRILETMIH